jgi:hypothetical protein
MSDDEDCVFVFALFELYMRSATNILKAIWLRKNIVNITCI